MESLYHTGDVMLDLETLGVTPNAVIVQIGAVYFDRNTGDLGDVFLKNIDIEASLKHGFTVDGSTIKFWLKGSEAARQSILQPGMTPQEVLGDLNLFLANAKAIWCHPNFDFALIENHFRHLGIKMSFNYRTPRCLRTLGDIAGVNIKNMKNEEVAHTSLGDCKHQIKYVVECFKQLAKGAK